MEHDRALTVEARNEAIPIVLGGATSLEEAIKQQTLLNNFVASQMKEGTDYGLIPGTKKKSLWEPGAEKLLFFNGLGWRFEVGPNTVIDWKAPFWNYEYKAVAFHKRSGIIVADCTGSANSKEATFAWRWAYESKIPRGMKKEELDCEERESKKGGTFMVYRIPNDDMFSLPNTIQKRAQKRALVGVSKAACRASENFTTDVEEEDAGHAEANKKDATGKKEASEKGKEQATKSAPSGDSDCISEPKLKRLYAIMKGVGVTEDHVKEFLKEKYPYTVVDGVAHLSKIRWKGDDYDLTVKWVESNQ